MGFGYDFLDFFRPSPVEGVRDTYRDVIRDTEDAVGSLREDIELLRAQLSAAMPTFHGSSVGDNSSGHVVTAFESAVDRCMANIDALIGPRGAFTQAVTDLEGRLGSVGVPGTLRYRKNILDTLCAAEDDREEEYSLSDIPF